MPDRELTFAQAVREALAEEMRRDSRVCIIGEDVAEGVGRLRLAGVKPNSDAIRIMISA